MCYQIWSLLATWQGYVRIGLACPPSVHGSKVRFAIKEICCIKKIQILSGLFWIILIILSELSKTILTKLGPALPSTLEFRNLRDKASLQDIGVWHVFFAFSRYLIGAPHGRRHSTHVPTAMVRSRIVAFLHETMLRRRNEISPNQKPIA